jgi:hypothetical protein
MITPVFGSVTDKKIIAVKKDKTPFNDSDLEYIKSIPEIASTNLYDAMSSFTLVLPIEYDHVKDYLNFSFDIVNDNITLSSGRIPTALDEIIISTKNGQPLTAPNLINEQLVPCYKGVDYKTEVIKIVGYTKADNEKNQVTYFTLDAAKTLRKKYIDQNGTITFINQGGHSILQEKFRF